MAEFREITAAGDTCNISNSADAVILTDTTGGMKTNRKIRELEKTLTDTEQHEIPLRPWVLVEVEEVVDELQARSREHPRDAATITSRLPSRLLERIRRLLSKKGLQELPSGKRPGARLRILEALALCLQNVKYVTFIDEKLVGDIELSSSEVEALYGKRSASSMTLKELSICIPGNASEKWEPESWRLLADILLRAQSLQIDMDDTPLSVLSQLAKAVAASGRGPLPVREVTLNLYGSRHLRGSGECTQSFIGEWAANLNVAAPNVKDLKVMIKPCAEGDVAELIGEAVASHQSLERLRINLLADETFLEDEELPDADDDESELGKLPRGTNDESASSGKKEMSSTPVSRLLSGAFLRHRSNLSINSFMVDFKSRYIDIDIAEDLEVLCQVLHNNIHITQLELCGLEQLGSCTLRGFFANLQVNHTQLQSLSLYGVDPYTFAGLVELLNSKAMRDLKRLELSFTRVKPDAHPTKHDWPCFYASLSRLESVKLRTHKGHQLGGNEMLDWITGSKVLQELYVETLYGVNWKSVFKSLRENTTLRVLSVSYEAIQDDATYRELMGLLQVNSTLQDVQFLRGRGWSSREAAVRELLKSKARQESYLAELRRGLGEGRAEWQSPKCGRIFLCGSPEAGKTRLTLTMLKLAEKKSLLKRFRERLIRRTEGVEIHTLRNDSDMQILVWDLAGQHIFRALQQFLFPRLSRASVFIFVFSPLESMGVRKLKFRLERAFEKELLEWLRFISSNSAVTGLNLPRVIVVISHKDIMDKLLEIGLDWCVTVLARVVKDFENIIQIHPQPFFVDSYEPTHVKPVLENVYSIFEELFMEKLFKVPNACSLLSQHLLQWSSLHPKEPIINDTEFFTLCGEIPDLKTFSANYSQGPNRKLLKAVGAYLHDVGSVIDMTLEEENTKKPKSNLIVVNPNWLTHVFLGRFICFRHGFQLTPGEDSGWEDEDGFLDQEAFTRLLHERKKTMAKKFPNLPLEILQDLMENLDLLYVTEVVGEEGHRTSLFFLPTLFKCRIEQNLHWAMHEGSQHSQEICYFGVRLRCKDPKRTSLSSAFFSRFQVMIWRKLTQVLKDKIPSIDCKFNLISISVDGLHIHVENDEDGDFIDVLISSAKTKRTGWNLVQTHIVREIREFCASSKGCPGVELDMDMIRTKCVKLLTPCIDRKNQSVSREDLKRRLMESIQDLGSGSEEKDLFWHTWREPIKPELDKGCESAIELLLPEDIDETYEYIKEKTESLQGKVSRLEAVAKGVDNDNRKLTLRGEVTQTIDSLPQVKKDKSAERTYSGLKNIERLILGVGEQVKVVLEEVRDLKMEMQELIQLHKREMQNLSELYQKLDKLMGQSRYTEEWPKLPYFTQKDVSVFHRITAVVKIGQPLMLHFHCEERDKPHFVPYQPGYEIIVGKENREFLRQISTTSVRVIWYLLKAGLHVSTGMGDLIPELHTSDSNTVLTSLSMTGLLRKVQVQDAPTSSQIATCSPEDAWNFLQDFLQMKLKDQITTHFLLHRAQYYDSMSTHAWLCQKCLQTGVKEKKLRKL